MIAYNKKFVKPPRQFTDKRILILGFGREGRDTLRFLRTQPPGAIFGVADQNPNLLRSDRNRRDRNRSVKWHFGKNYLKAIKKYDVVIKSPGIPHKIITPFISKRQKITSATEIFFDLCPGTIIGITGTKGKSTTSAMIYHVLKKVGLRAHLVGNIGKPALSSLLRAGPHDIFVYELSSHQLWGLRKSPHTAVFLNIYPEHLDYYRNFKEYANAKANICAWQTNKDHLVYNAQDKLVSSFARKSKAKKIPIRGKYYELDREAARAVGKIFGVRKKAIEGALKTFKPLAHRLELVGAFRGIAFYNDSLSTIPQTTIEALDFLGSKVQTLIVGGFDRGIDYRPLAVRIAKSSIKTMILFPPSGIRIREELEKISPPKSLSYFLAENMKRAVTIAFSRTEPGRMCLLSPASASFGLFKDYQERGNAFKRYVKYWGRKL